MVKLIDSKTLAAWIDAEESTIRKWTFQNKIPYIKCGKLVRFDPEEIARWLKSNKK